MPEERVGGQALSGRRHPEVLVHRSRGHRDIESVRRVDRVAKAQERKQPPNDFVHVGVLGIDLNAPSFRAIYAAWPECRAESL
jgi:hypothetical protein